MHSVATEKNTIDFAVELQKIYDSEIPTLLDYLPQDSIMFLDESHQTVPQLLAGARIKLRRHFSRRSHL